MKVLLLVFEGALWCLVGVVAWAWITHRTNGLPNWGDDMPVPPPPPPRTDEPDADAEWVAAVETWKRRHGLSA